MILFLLILLILSALILTVLLAPLHEELDDVHPYILNIDDIENDPLVQRSKWLWVIPLYMGEPLSNHPQWIKKLKDSGKRIGLHGVYHTKTEFGIDRSDEYIDKGIDEFTKAFGYHPTHFKAPGLELTTSNREKLEARGLKIKGKFNQIIHQVHHSPKGRRENGWLIGE